jgi:hypothetical protein
VNDPQFRGMVVSAVAAQRPSPSDEPSLLQRAANLATAAARHVASGAKIVSEDVRARRLALCLACEHYVDKKCVKCGCSIKNEAGMIDKLSWESSQCPVGKW